MADIKTVKLGGTTYNIKDASAIANITRSGTTFTATKRDGSTFTFTQQDNNDDTKNTAGSTDTASKIFLIGATSQAANPQTYSQDTAYVGTDGCLYSNSTKVSVEGHTHSYAGSSSAGGAASTAVKFSSSQSVALTGDVTGSASSQAGWSVATTLANSGVTAGSYGPSANASPAHGGTFSVPYVTVDAKGRVTGASTKTITLPSDSDTHHTAYIRAGASGGTDNAATTAGNTYINLVENGSNRSGVKIVGSGATSVTSDANGVITISSTDNNTIALTSMTGTLGIGHGGTGATTAAGARTNLGLDSYITDSGWKVLGLNGTDWQAYSTDYTPHYRKVGHVVEIVGVVKAASGKTVTVGSDFIKINSTVLPAAYRPTQRTVDLMPGSGYNKFAVDVRPDGYVYVGRYGTTAAYVNVTENAWLPFHLTYLV